MDYWHRCNYFYIIFSFHRFYYSFQRWADYYWEFNMGIYLFSFHLNGHCEHPDQHGLKRGEKRVVMSFRATGEVHISSIVFREAILDAENNLHHIEPGNLDEMPECIKRTVYNKKSFVKKLDEMNIHKDIVNLVMDRLKNSFTYGELQAAIAETLKDVTLTPTKRKVIEEINWVADSHYEIKFSLDTSLSERVIFPISYSESNGIEDARFVKFTDDNATILRNCALKALFYFA